MFFDLKKILFERLREQGVGEAVLAAQVVDTLKAVLAETLGESAVASLRKVSYKGDVLEILCGSSALASELRMRQYDISGELSSKLNGRPIRLRIFG